VFVRHFEDSAKIILAESSLPSLEMEAEKQIVELPTSDDPAFAIPSTPRGHAIRLAYDAIAAMFWGRRIPLDDACRTISEWIRRVT